MQGKREEGNKGGVRSSKGRVRRSEGVRESYGMREERAREERMREEGVREEQVAALSSEEQQRSLGRGGARTKG